MKPFAFLFCALLAAVAMAADPPRPPAGKGGAPPARPVARQAPDTRIGALLLPQVNFRESDFEGALGYFKHKAEQESGGALKLVFVEDLPQDFRPRHVLTLELRNVPFLIALNYLGELAGVQFTIEGTTITARAGVALRPPETPLPQEAVSSVRGSGALLKPAAPVAAGNNAYRKIDGTIQPDKSGNVPHRSMSGWSIHQDPTNMKSVNCSSGKPCEPPCQCTCSCGQATNGKSKPAK